MKSIEEIKEKLEKEYDLYKCTHDAMILHHECYERIKTLEWVLEEEK